MSKSKLFKRTLWIVCSVILLLVLSGIGCGAYFFFSPNFMPEKTAYVYIYPDKDYEDLCRQLEDSAGCSNIHTFRQAARLLKYPGKMNTGRYAVTRGMSNYELLKSLRRGYQTPVRITFNNIRMKQDLADRLSQQLMIENHELMKLMNDSDYCRSMGFTPPTIKAMFIPNTYEVYWNISAEKLMQRMKREYDAFWTDARRNKAARISLSPLEVAVLASIVEEESAMTDEYPTIAGLYLNRLYKGIYLQADPTVKYALGDFTIQRVLNRHKTIDSPYNTYMYGGLPPAPLRIPSIQGLDAVLNYKKHHYLYMCAKEDFSGRHNFASTLTEHNQNARRYQEELNRRGIY